TPVKDEINIYENGNKREIKKITCPENHKAKAISVGLSIDNSESMSMKSYDRKAIHYSKLIARKIVSSTEFNPAEYLVQRSNEIPVKLLDFSSDTLEIIRMINYINIFGNNEFNQHLSNDEAGILRLTNDGKYSKYALMLTDGFGNPLHESYVNNMLEFC